MKPLRIYGLLTFILPLFVCSGSLLSQSTDMGNWLIYIGNQKISPRWMLWNEVQHRNYNALGDLEQLLIRAGAGYDIAEGKGNLLCGYGYIHARPYVGSENERADIIEHRIWQQIISRQNFGPLSVQHRYRFEQRFIEDQYRTRFRYFLGLNLPLNKPKMERRAVYLALYNEVWLSPQRNVFDRDRLYGGIGYVFNEYLRMETAVMNQIYESHFRTQFQIALFNNLPLIKS